MMAYGETNLEQFKASFIAENIKEVNKNFIWWFMGNHNIRIDRCEYDEGTRWTVLKVFYSIELKEDEKE